MDIKNIYEDMTTLAEEALNGEFTCITSKFSEEDFQAIIENKLFQLYRKNKIIGHFNNLIEPYAHRYEVRGGYTEGERDKFVNIAMRAYCMITICIYGWSCNQVSTNDTICCLVKLLNYIRNNHQYGELSDHIDRLLWSTEQPFFSERTYGRFFIQFPEPLKQYEDTTIDDKVLHARAFFLMLFFEMHGGMRLRYARECERITSSLFFRHSQYKAQVMFNCASDDQRTRLSHSLEVAGLARTIAKQLGCNWELVEAMALGHDLGHVPFGHQGEEKLDACLHNAWAGRFSHSLQSVKVLDELAVHGSLFDKFGITGLCLSRPTLEGILKHDTDNLLHDIGRAGWRLQHNNWREVLVRYDDEGKLDETEWKDGVTIGGLESQIVYWSDKIAYTSHDWDELVQSGNIQKMTDTLDNLLKRMHQIKHNLDKTKKISHYIAEEYHTIKTEFDIIRFIRLSVEDIRQGFAVPKKEAEKNSTPAGIFRVLHPSDSNQKSSLRHLVDGLGKFIDTINMTSDDLKLQYFTIDDYKLLRDFFSTVYHWIKITKIYPKPYKKSDDVLWILCRYLEDIDNRAVVRALKAPLIRRSRENIQKFSNLTEPKVRDLGKKAFEEELDSEGFDMQLLGSFESFQTELGGRSTLNAIRAYLGKFGYDDSGNSKIKDRSGAIKKWFKIQLQRKMLISIDYSIIESLDVISDFVRSYYWESPKVSAMRVKAHMIIKRIFDFFMLHENMLPVEYQRRIRFEAQKLSQIYYNDSPPRSHKLAFQYLQERHLEYRRQAGDAVRDDATNRIPAKNFFTTLKKDLDCLNGKGKLEKVPEVVEKIIVSEDWGKDDNEAERKHTKLHFDFCLHITKARVIADYIASMTDRMAEKKYNEIVSSSTTWSTTYAGDHTH